MHLQASNIVKAGTLLCTDADGKVQSLPTDNGTYTCIGMALTDGMKDSLIEVATSLPHKIEIKE